MVARSLMRHKIEELEQLFVALKKDKKTLKALEEELRHWQTSRAAALLAKVQKTLKEANLEFSPDAVPKPTIVPNVKNLNQQPDLWQLQSTLIPQIDPKPVIAQQGVPQVNHSEPPLKATAPARAASNVTDTTHRMSIDEAYKILKVTSSSTWETIEQTRRQVVQQAHPTRLVTLDPERRTRFEVEAKRANVAYAVLFQHRTAISDNAY